jgi:hypothetical protein
VLHASGDEQAVVAVVAVVDEAAAAGSCIDEERERLPGRVQPLGSSPTVSLGAGSWLTATEPGSGPGRPGFGRAMASR